VPNDDLHRALWKLFSSIKETYCISYLMLYNELPQTCQLKTTGAFVVSQHFCGSEIQELLSWMVLAQSCLSGYGQTAGIG